MCVCVCVCVCVHVPHADAVRVLCTCMRAQLFPGSKYTACVMDVRVGKLDLCIGNFWVTSQRLSIVDFVQPFAEDRIYLLTFQLPSADTLSGAFHVHMSSILRLRRQSGAWLLPPGLCARCSLCVPSSRSWYQDLEMANIEILVSRSRDGEHHNLGIKMVRLTPDCPGTVWSRSGADYLSKPFQPFQARHLSRTRTRSLATSCQRVLWRVRPSPYSVVRNHA
jgi:hypothetical protein